MKQNIAGILTIFLVGCSQSQTISSSSYSCLEQLSTEGNCTLPTVCVDYSGSGWTGSSASVDCSSTGTQEKSFQAMSGCTSSTPSFSFSSLVSCAGQVPSASTLIATCTLRGGTSTQQVYNYYNSASLPIQARNTVTDCAAKGGVYTAAAGSGKIYLYTTPLTYTGSIGSRNAADNLCTLVKNNNYNALSCTSTHAVMSFSSSDQINTMATEFSIGATNPVYDASSTVNQIATSWSNFVSGTLSLSLQTAGVTSTFFWTGTLGTGAVDSTNSCSGWTSTGGNGTLGQANALTSSWLNGSGTQYCSSSASLLCACY